MLSYWNLDLLWFLVLTLKSSEKFWNYDFFRNFRTSELSQTTPLPPSGNVRNFKTTPPPHLLDVLCRRPLMYLINRLPLLRRPDRLNQRLHSSGQNILETVWCKDLFALTSALLYAKCIWLDEMICDWLFSPLQGNGASFWQFVLVSGGGGGGGGGFNPDFWENTILRYGLAMMARTCTNNLRVVLSP